VIRVCPGDHLSVLLEARLHLSRVLHLMRLLPPGGTQRAPQKQASLLLPNHPMLRDPRESYRQLLGLLQFLSRCYHRDPSHV
jgi:hypothetical protein